MINETSHEYSTEPYNLYIFTMLSNALVLLYYPDMLGEEFNVVNSQIMQYTGINDKNGVEIYEGDIIRHTMYDIQCNPLETNNHQIIFDTENACFCMQYSFGAFADQYRNEFEVIGNIYENKELLK